LGLGTSEGTRTPDPLLRRQGIKNMKLRSKWAGNAWFPSKESEGVAMQKSNDENIFYKHRKMKKSPCAFYFHMLK